MKAEYTEHVISTKIVDIDEFWLDWLSKSICQSEKNWHDYLVTDEPYCYGRNNIYLNYYYAETKTQQIYYHTIIPPEVWDIPNKIYAKLIGFQNNTQRER